MKENKMRCPACKEFASFYHEREARTTYTSWVRIDGDTAYLDTDSEEAYEDNNYFDDVEEVICGKCRNVINVANIEVIEGEL